MDNHNLITAWQARGCKKGLSENVVSIKLRLFFFEEYLYYNISVSLVQQFEKIINNIDLMSNNLWKETISSNGK